MAQTISKSTFRRCRDLRERAGLSMTKLAGSADVSRDLIRSLERGNPHSTHKVMAVFNALQESHNGSLLIAEELTSV